MGRGSDIRVRVTLDTTRTKIEEILLSGDAVEIIAGKIPIPSPETTLLSGAMQHLEI
ncbi:hypothetical protein GGS23DRAFT_596024 [Durotheca rogersii]|uniref:uncharacterized protein n=1 Tax=Durotheca rogersii TaxID=419775 RepID=UPI0022203DE4|nr:uncharacterized protein GGS23DRAFT_596024 [Durotheca rogersii]KAI5864392.1 hypothetical protein GGS23DRAFT_596024 [Durotheca rogersii]